MRPPCWWWLAQIPAYNTSRPPSLLALPCVAAWLACWCRWRFVPCWPFAWRLARFRCAGGIITPAAPVALDIRPFPCLVSKVYTSTSRANAGGGLVGLVWPFPVLALRLLGWLAAPVRINIRRRDLSRAAGVARCPHLRPVLPVSRRFGGLSALRWCPMLARCPCARFAGVGVLVR